LAPEEDGCEDAEDAREPEAEEIATEELMDAVAEAEADDDDTELEL